MKPVAEPDKKVLGGHHQNKLKYINDIAYNIQVVFVKKNIQVVINKKSFIQNLNYIIHKADH